MQRRKNPAGGPGLKKNTHCACREDNTPIRLAGQGFCAVSYTHLTLPTNSLV